MKMIFFHFILYIPGNCIQFGDKFYYDAYLSGYTSLVASDRLSRHSSYLEQSPSKQMPDNVITEYLYPARLILDTLLNNMCTYKLPIL